MRRALSVALLAAAVVVPGAVAAPPAAADSIGWQTASNLSSTVAQVDPGDAVALRDGTVLAVWGQATSVGGAQTPFVGSTSAAGSTVVALDVAGGTAAQPVVAASDDGSVRVAAWKSMSGASRVLRWSRWTGSSWSPAATLLMNVSESVELDLQLSRDGRFGVLAAVSTGGTLFAFRFDGTGFAGPDTMASSASLVHPVAAVARSAERAVLGWIQLPSGGGSATAFYARRWNGSSWGSLANVSQEPTGRSTVQGALGLSADGERAMAAWRSTQGAAWTAAAATAIGSSWSAPSPLTDTSYVAVDSLGLALTDDAAGAQAVFSVRTSAAGNNVFVLSNRYAAGAWSGTTVRTGPFRAEAEPRPSLAMSRDGLRGLLVYQEWDSSNNKRPRALLYADGAWQSPPGSSLSSFNADDRSGVGLAALSGNGTLGGAVWRQQTGGQQVAQASRLTIRTAPSAPRDVVAEVVAPGAVRVSWLPSEFDGNWPFPDYAAIAAPNHGVPCSTITTSCVVTGLLPGQEYTFTVYAENVEGATVSLPSAPVTMPGGGTVDPSPSDPPAPDASSAPAPAPVPTDAVPGPAPVPTTATGTGSGSAAVPGAVARITVTQGKKVGERRRSIRVRWAPAPGASAYRIRITKPGGKRWRAWTTQTPTRTRFTVVVSKRYRVCVLPVAGATPGTPVVKAFRVRR